MPEMATQRVLEVINALKIRWDGAVALDGVKVSKAWEYLPEGDAEHVFIGSDVSTGLGSNEELAASVIEWPGMSPASRIEDGTVDCAASVWTDNETAIDTAINRAYAIIGACEDALRVDPSLNSSIALQAKIVRTALRLPVHDSEGFAAIVAFTVAFQTSV